MRCEQFQQRMDQLLDQRRELRGDRPLHQHAQRCAECQRRLDLWCKINQALAFQDPEADSAAGSVTPVAVRHRQRIVHRIATAAAILVASLAGWMAVSDSSSQKIASPVELAQPIAAQQPGHSGSLIDAETDSVAAGQPSELARQSQQWWDVVQDDSWVDRTIPAVNSVRYGVAPIGRTMRRAFTILMIQAETASPLRSPVGTSDAPVIPFKEQTSVGNSWRLDDRLV
ncbi:hypothetical protein NHH03_20815 [Stieleria sp. TO1_6]|uniref:anti-sigma factor family protein n=1 Tax=Stieleria tagensis TaxID=2956795 RepID=UPI00209BBA00|nr:hypothetical protein [Stieleria tagensis]MCO8124198.1 hypothetical protein [Stieleria tagensis]